MKTYARWIVGQDHTELHREDGTVTSYPRWTAVDKNTIGLAMLRATPKHVGDAGIHRAEQQSFLPQSETVAQIGRTLSRVARRT